jgi:sugar-specific transcriptional regulator TrmB
MNWADKELNILGLNTFERKILASISTACQLSEIARITGILRTSIAYCLKGLLRRELIQRVRFGKRYRYIAISPDILINKIQSVAVSSALRDSSTIKGARIRMNLEDEFIIHIGSKEIIPAFKRIAENNKNERIKAIQHHRSFNDQVEVATPKQISEFNSAIIKNNIIIEGILNKSAYGSYLHEIISNPEKAADAIKTLEGRMADYSVFPDNRFDYHAEIWIFRMTTLIINWKKKVAIEIINSDMTKFIGEMYEYVKDSSEKIDHNEMMRELVKKVSEKTAPQP